MKKSPRLSATEGLAFSQEKTLAWKDDREGAGCDWNLRGGCRQGGPGALTPSHPPQVWKPEQTSAFRYIVLTQSTSTFYFYFRLGFVLKLPEVWRAPRTRVQEWSTPIKLGLQLGTILDFSWIPRPTHKNFLLRDFICIYAYIHINVCVHTCRHICVLQISFEGEKKAHLFPSSSKSIPLLGKLNEDTTSCRKRERNLKKPTSVLFFRFYIESISFLKDKTTVELFFLNAKSCVHKVRCPLFLRSVSDSRRTGGGGTNGIAYISMFKQRKMAKNLFHCHKKIRKF